MKCLDQKVACRQAKFVRGRLHRSGTQFGRGTIYQFPGRSPAPDSMFQRLHYCCQLKSHIEYEGRGHAIAMFFSMMYERTKKKKKMESPSPSK